MLRSALVALALVAVPAAAAQPAAPAAVPPAVPSGVSLAEALAAATVESPGVALAAEAVAIERAGLRAASAAFEPRLYASVGGGQAETPQTALQQSSGLAAGVGYQQYEVGVTRRFRSGLEVTPLVALERTALDGAAPLVETTAGLAVAYPVLGGRARDGAVAAEAAASGRVRAATADGVRAREAAAAEAALAYWDYVGAVRVREALVVSEGRADRLLTETETLVAADERPAADLVALRADLARRTAARLGADQAVYDARQRLGLAMGGSATAADALGPPTDPLPPVPAAVDVDEGALTARALEGRTDLRAAALRARALEREADAAWADLRPSVDVVVDARYAALNEGALGPQDLLPLGIGAARGGQLGLTLRVNRLGSGATRAAAERRRAAVARAAIARDDLARRVRAAVAGAVAGLRGGAAEVAQTRAAVGLYEEAVGNERQRLRLGMGTLFDVQIVEERLANARTAAVRAEVRYAQALVRLHAAVGTLAAAPAAALDTLPR